MPMEKKELPQIDRELEALLDKRLAVWGDSELRENARQLLFCAMEEIDGCGGMLERENGAGPIPGAGGHSLPRGAVCGCAGVEGAYSHIACEQAFRDPQIRFYEQFEDVFHAVRQGEVTFGVVPVENSSAGAVDAVLELVGHSGMYINAAVSIRVSHCLCVRPDTDLHEVREVLSHPQALAQCKGFLKERGYTPRRFSNTAAAAKAVSESTQPLACVCSWRGAQLYGLRVLEQGIEDFTENYTRFACVSRENLLLEGADTVSITLSCPNETGSLNRLLMRFALCDLNLSKIQSMPIASRDYSVIFHMDFKGSVRDKKVAALLRSMSGELEHFRYLGNYPVLFEQPTTEA